MKNVVKKLVIVMAVVLSICVFSNTALAANTTNSTDDASKNTTASKNETTDKKETKTEKSSNANLSDLGIKPHDFSGFKYGTTTYDVTVPSDVEEIEVYAKTQDEKAKVSGTGMKTLKDGLNSFEVKVTAENGATKTYTINVTREKEKTEESDNAENTENVQEKYSGDGLASLTIGDLELSPKFDTTIYEYKVKYIGEATKLDIKATGTDPYYNVEITGNEELKEGENLITILVSDPDGNNVATYQVTVNKSLVDEEAIAREQEEAKKKEELRNILIIGGIVAVVIAIVIIISIVRHSRHKAWAEEYSIPYSGLNNNDDYDDEDEAEYEDKHEEKISKEKAREAFLSGYNSDNKNDYKEKDEAPRRKHKKGKRFK